MKKITNLELLNAATMVLIFIELTIAVSGNLTSPTMTLCGTSFLIGIILYLYGRCHKKVLPKKEDIWFQPVSNRLGSIVINAAVLLWLVLSAAIVVMIISISHSRSALALALVLFVGALGCGIQLKKNFSSYSLLAYGITSFVAFCIFLTCVVAIKFH